MKADINHDWKMHMLDRIIGRRVVAIFAVAISMTAIAADGSPQKASGGISPLQSCTLPDLTRTARCGSIAVPEDWRAPNGRKIAVRVALLPAHQRPGKKDPILILMGGPGESAIEAASLYARWLAPVLVERDLLLIDQRGAGGSAPLRCPLGDRRDPAPLLENSFPPVAIEQCTSDLAKTADLTHYGYSPFARDVEHIRKALDYKQLNLFASSYGTRAAQVYLRSYPASVRTAYLGSVVPIDVATPITMARTAQAELESLFNDCSADPECERAYPKLRSEFNVVIERLNRGEARSEIKGEKGEFVMRAAPAVAWLRSKLYRPSTASIIPWAVHRAYQGDWSPMAEGIVASPDPSFSYGLFFAITCNEDVRFIDQGKVAQASRGTFLGATRVRQQGAACRFWPQSPLPEGYREPVRSSVPTLFVTGEADGGTPTSFTDHAAKHFAESAVLLAPGQGHTEWSPCIASRYFGLVRQGRMTGAKRASCPLVLRPPFKPESHR